MIRAYSGISGPESSLLKGIITLDGTVDWNSEVIAHKSPVINGYRLQITERHSAISPSLRQLPECPPLWTVGCALCDCTTVVFVSGV